MAGIRFEKLVSALPEVLTANTMYMVKNGEGFDIYVSDSAGNDVVKMNNSYDNEVHPFLLMGVGNA